jgi:hypothetical protein
VGIKEGGFLHIKASVFETKFISKKFISKNE